MWYKNSTIYLNSTCGQLPPYMRDITPGSRKKAKFSTQSAFNHPTRHFSIMYTNILLLHYKKSSINVPFNWWIACKVRKKRKKTAQTREWFFCANVKCYCNIFYWINVSGNKKHVCMCLSGSYYSLFLSKGSCGI